jgi:hypothetical protein
MLPTLKLNIERWKYNPTFELYVSNMGHIRNKSKADIAPKIMTNGYVVVYVYGSLNQYMLLHRVVMLTWKPTPEAEKLTVDHLDHNKRNNALSNLEWVTKEENLRRAEDDYVGNVCIYGNILGCKREEVCPLAAVPAKMKQSEPVMTDKQKRKAETAAWIARVKTVKSYYVQPSIAQTKDKQAFRQLASPNAVRELIKRLGTYKLGGFSADKLFRKFESIANGTTKNDYIEYCGMRITFEYDGPSAADYGKE